MKRVLFYCLVSLLMVVVAIADPLECARSCVFLPRSINGTFPTNACPTVIRENIQCSALVEFNHQTRLVSGSLSVRTFSEISALRMETIVKLESTVFSIFRYTCMRNSCDVEFLTDLLSHLKDRLDTDVATAINETVSLIYNPANKGIINCTNGTDFTCDNSLCQASFGFNTTSDVADIISSKNLPCSPSRSDYLLNIKGSWDSTASTTEMIIRCNVENCLDDPTAEKVYQSIWNTNLLVPVGLDNLDGNETYPIPASAGNPSLMLPYRLIIGVALFLSPRQI